MGVVRFFSLGGRIGPGRWLACAVLTAGLGVLCLFGLRLGEGPVPPALGALLGLVLAKLATESARRLHDCGQSAGVGVAPATGIVALIATAVVRWLGHGPDLLFGLALMLAAGSAGLLLLRPGAMAENGFGPPPAPFEASPSRSGHGAGLASTAVLLTVGLAFGLGVLRWEAGMDRQREDRLRRAGPPGQAMSVAHPAASADRGLDAANAKLSNQIDGLLERSEPR